MSRVEISIGDQIWGCSIYTRDLLPLELFRFANRFNLVESSSLISLLQISKEESGRRGRRRTVQDAEGNPFQQTPTFVIRIVGLTGTGHSGVTRVGGGGALT